MSYHPKWKSKRGLLAFLIAGISVLSLILAVAILPIVRISAPLLALGPNQQVFSSPEELQREVGELYDILYPTYLPDGMAFVKAVYQRDVRDASLIFECANHRLYIIHEFGYNSAAAPPGFTANRLPPQLNVPQLTLSIRGKQGYYAAANQYQLIWWAEDTNLAIKLLAEPLSSASKLPPCQVNQRELIATSDSFRSDSDEK